MELTYPRVEMMFCAAVWSLVRSEMTVVTRDRRTVLDNILTITVRPLTGNI